jgi:rhamnosyltransferase
VTFFPKESELSPLLFQLAEQTDFIVVVDNTPRADNVELNELFEMSATPSRCKVIRFGENKGLAAGLNEGCTTALEMGADYLLLSDQDSLPSPGMVASLLHCIQQGQPELGNIAAAGPTYTDLHSEVTYPFQYLPPNKLLYRRVHTGPDRPWVDALTLITSGTLISAHALAKIGLMREDLFIDQIDIEWCLRARHLGFHLLGCGAARMDQRMGEGSIPVWYLSWRKEPHYSPARLYYRFRNYIALLYDPRIDSRWKLRVSWYHLGLIYTHLVFGPSRWATLRSIALGTLDGFTKKMGKTPRQF